jgi:hypothetical protein
MVGHNRQTKRHIPLSYFVCKHIFAAGRGEVKLGPRFKFYPKKKKYENDGD